MGFLYAANKGFVKGVDLFVERGCNIEAKNDVSVVAFPQLLV